MKVCSCMYELVLDSVVGNSFLVNEETTLATDQSRYDSGNNSGCSAPHKPKLGRIAPDAS